MTRPSDAQRASDTRPIILLVGPAGAGKGTQASELARDLGVLHLATGDLFRAALRDGTPLGERARRYIERGELVPDEITIGLVAEALTEPVAASGAVLDGFPRTVAQAAALDAILEGSGDEVSRVVFIDVPAEVVIARLSGRWVCPTCGSPFHVTFDPPRRPGLCDHDGSVLVQREDDREDVVRARLATQIPPMREVLAYYRDRGIVRDIDGTQPIDAVGDAIRRALDD